MRIFSFLKRKPKHLSVVEYDKLVDSKLEKIRAFVRLHIYAKPDDKDFEEALAKAFELYLFNLKQELTKTAPKWTIPLPWKKRVLSPINAIHAFNQIYYRRRKKVVWYKRLLRYFKSIRVYVILFFKDLALRRELLEIKKLFPDYKMSNKTALGLLKAVDVNKRVMKKYPQVTTTKK